MFNYHITCVISVYYHIQSKHTYILYIMHDHYVTHYSYTHVYIYIYISIYTHIHIVYYYHIRFTAYIHGPHGPGGDQP